MLGIPLIVCKAERFGLSRQRNATFELGILGGIWSCVGVLRLNMSSIELMPVLKTTNKKISLSYTYFISSVLFSRQAVCYILIEHLS